MGKGLIALVAFFLCVGVLSAIATKIDKLAARLDVIEMRLEATVEARFDEVDAKLNRLLPSEWR
jgi:hypothetical protein